jgi:hypothetical protein
MLALIKKAKDDSPKDWLCDPNGIVIPQFYSGYENDENNSATISLPSRSIVLSHSAAC